MTAIFILFFGVVIFSYLIFEFIAKIFPVIFILMIILSVILGIMMLLNGKIIQFLLYIPLTGLFIYIMKVGGDALVFRTNKEDIGAFGDMVGYCIGNVFNLMFLILAICIYFGIAGTMIE